MSFLHIDRTQVVEILPQVRQEPTYSTYPGSLRRQGISSNDIDLVKPRELALQSSIILGECSERLNGLNEIQYPFCWKINNCRIYIEVAIILSSSQLQEFNPLIAQ